jgi:hypothetical protein
MGETLLALAILCGNTVWRADRAAKMLGRVLINRQPNADLDAPAQRPSMGVKRTWRVADIAPTEQSRSVVCHFSTRCSVAKCYGLAIAEGVSSRGHTQRWPAGRSRLARRQASKLPTIGHLTSPHADLNT